MIIILIPSTPPLVQGGAVHIFMIYFPRPRLMSPIPHTLSFPLPFPSLAFGMPVASPIAPVDIKSIHVGLPLLSNGLSVFTLRFYIVELY